jgi:hypothetical protein
MTNLIETNEKLGLGHPPTPVYLFVDLNKDDEGPYCWYTRDHDADLNIPVRERALTGYLREVKISQHEYKGEPNLKVNFKFQADRTYIVRTGATTTFARSIILALLQVPDFAKPICIAAKPGDEVVIGCVYQSGDRVTAEWDGDVQLFPLIQNLQTRLAQKQQTMKDVQDEFNAKKAR